MSDKIKLQFPEDHFVIPLKDQFLLYIPLKGLVYHLNATALEETCYGLQNENSNQINLSASTIDIIEQIRNTNKFALDNQIVDETLELFPLHYLTLDLSSICSLACVYCYAESGDRLKEFMDFNCAKAAINLCIKNIDSLPLEHRFFYLVLHGGSEPTINWDLFTSVIKYAQESCHSYKIPLNISMSSNGYYSKEGSMDYEKFDKCIIIIRWVQGNPKYSATSTKR